MDKSWNYIYNMSSDEENVIRTTLQSICGNEAKEKNILEVLADISITKQSYDDFLQNILISLSAPVNRTELSLDIYVLAQLIKFVLENNKELKEKFCKQENFASVSSFSHEFDTKIRLSKVFVMRLPAYALLLSGAIDAKQLSKMVGGTIASTVVAGVVASSLTAVPGSILLSLATICGPIGLVSAGLFLGIKGVMSIFDDSKIVNLKKYWPLYMVLIQIHASHTQRFRSIDEAKAFILEMSSSIKDDNDNSINRPFAYKKWANSRIAFLQFLLKEGEDVLCIPRDAFWKEKISIYASECKLTQYVPMYILQNLLNIPNMDRKQVIYELIDFLYGMRASNLEKSYYKSFNKFIETENIANHKCLVVDFCFPFSIITPSVVFYVPREENEACEHLLTQIYLDIHGYNVSEYFSDNLEKIQFDYILGRYKLDTFNKYLSKDGLYLSAEILLEKKAEHTISKQLSSYQKDEKIKELEKCASALKRQLEDKNIFCHRFHHDLGNIFTLIVAPFEAKEYSPNYVITNEDVKKAMQEVKLFRKLWDRLIKEDDYEKKDTVPAQDLMDILCKEIEEKRILRGNRITDKVNVTMSKNDFCNVIHNLTQNLDRHAFPSNNSQSDCIVTIETQIIDNELRFYVGNNGEPYEGDINKFFEYKLDTQKGLGVSSMRECMRHFDGDLNVSLEADHTITYIFSFKICNYV